MRILVIANPIAGGGRGREQANRLADTLQDHGHDVDCLLTTRSGDARNHAADYHDRVDRIVAVGGDGTVNEILNGLPNPDLVPIAQLPMGTANIMARELALPWDVPGLVDLLEQQHVRRIDMGELNGRRFLDIASCGFDAMVVEAIHKTRRGGLGFLGYIVPVIATALRYRPPKLTVHAAGQTYHGEQVVVANIRNYAAFFAIADRAQCDDGQLDLVVFPRARRRDLALAAYLAFRKQISARSSIPYVRASSIRITAEHPVPVELDGDFVCYTDVEIQLHPQAVQFCAPPVC